MRVELIADRGCPNLPLARERLREALERLGMAGEWEEHVRPEATDRRIAGWPSPTILVDDTDVEGREAEGGACCRIYRDAEGRVSGAPSVTRIVDALRRASER